MSNLPIIINKTIIPIALLFCFFLALPSSLFAKSITKSQLSIAVGVNPAAGTEAIERNHELFEFLEDVEFLLDSDYFKNNIKDYQWTGAVIKLESIFEGMKIIYRQSSEEIVIPESFLNTLSQEEVDRIGIIIAYLLTADQLKNTFFEGLPEDSILNQDEDLKLLVSVFIQAQAFYRSASLSLESTLDLMSYIEQTNPAFYEVLQSIKYHNRASADILPVIASKLNLNKDLLSRYSAEDLYKLPAQMTPRKIEWIDFATMEAILKGLLQVTSNNKKEVLFKHRFLLSERLMEQDLPAGNNQLISRKNIRQLKNYDSLFRTKSLKEYLSQFSKLSGRSALSEKEQFELTKIFFFDRYQIHLISTVNQEEANLRGHDVTALTESDYQDLIQLLIQVDSQLSLSRYRPLAGNPFYTINLVNNFAPYHRLAVRNTADSASIFSVAAFVQFKAVSPEDFIQAFRESYFSMVVEYNEFTYAPHGVVGNTPKKRVTRLFDSRHIDRVKLYLYLHDNPEVLEAFKKVKYKSNNRLPINEYIDLFVDADERNIYQAIMDVNQENEPNVLNPYQGFYRIFEIEEKLRSKIQGNDYYLTDLFSDVGPYKKRLIDFTRAIFGDSFLWAEWDPDQKSILGNQLEIIKAA